MGTEGHKSLSGEEPDGAGSVVPHKTRGQRSRLRSTTDSLGSLMPTQGFSFLLYKTKRLEYIVFKAPSN